MVIKFLLIFPNIQCIPLYLYIYIYIIHTLYCILYIPYIVYYTYSIVYIITIVIDCFLRWTRITYVRNSAADLFYGKEVNYVSPDDVRLKNYQEMDNVSHLT